ncbi:MAG: recombination protein RecR [Parcubacteria group bacterium]|nr:recombination protein RecR [Parcubacteria group bacterium]
MIPEPLKKFIDYFAKLPGIGPRQASRIAFWLVKQPPSLRESYAKSFQEVSERIGVCRKCYFVFDKVGNGEVCHICRDANRDRSLIAVVEKETDLITIEKTKRFHGLYHVLGGTISPLEVENKNLKIPELIERIKKSSSPVKEVILALSPTSEGDLTSFEIEKALSGLDVKITRLGRGLPRGAEVEFADEETIGAALDGRR